MLRIILLGLLIFMVGCDGCGQDEPDEAVSPDYFSDDFNTSLTSFYDKFNGNSLDPTKWGHYTSEGFSDIIPGYGEESFHAENVSVRNGMLVITAKKENKFADARFSSGRIVTYNNEGRAKSLVGSGFAQTYGRFEAKIRFSRYERGIWPAFWMVPADWTYGPHHYSGEIDIMEINPSVENSNTTTLHFRKEDDTHGMLSTWTRLEDGHSLTDWNVFGVQWTPDEIIFLLNGKESARIAKEKWNAWYLQPGFTTGQEATPSAPFDRGFYMILNLAIGGEWDGHREPPDSAFPIEMHVDWVRAYTLETVLSKNFPYPITGVNPPIQW